MRVYFSKAKIIDKFLKPTVGRWIGAVEGHHFFEGGGATTDQFLCDWLKTTFLGTAAYIRIPKESIAKIGTAEWAPKEEDES